MTRDIQRVHNERTDIQSRDNKRRGRTIDNGRYKFVNDKRGRCKLIECIERVQESKTLRTGCM